MPETTVGHSAEVEIQLSVNGTLLSVAQLAPEFVIIEKPMQHHPANGEILLRVDGRESRWAISLPEGISGHEKKVRIVNE